MHVREYVDTDWTSVWPIFREVVTVGEALPYDPKRSFEQAQDMRV